MCGRGNLEFWNDSAHFPWLFKSNFLCPQRAKISFDLYFCCCLTLSFSWEKICDELLGICRPTLKICPVLNDSPNEGLSLKCVRFYLNSVIAAENNGSYRDVYTQAPQNFPNGPVSYFGMRFSSMRFGTPQRIALNLSLSQDLREKKLGS